MGKKMYYYSCFFYIGEWVPGGRVDPATDGGETRVPTSTPTFCLGSGCTSNMHHASMFTRTVEGLPDAKLSRGYSFVTIC